MHTLPHPSLMAGNPARCDNPPICGIPICRLLQGVWYDSNSNRKAIFKQANVRLAPLGPSDTPLKYSGPSCGSSGCGLESHLLKVIDEFPPKYVAWRCYSWSKEDRRHPLWLRHNYNGVCTRHRGDGMEYTAKQLCGGCTCCYRPASGRHGYMNKYRWWYAGFQLILPGKRIGKSAMATVPGYVMC